MTSSRIKGIAIQIDGDTTKLGKTLESAWEKAINNYFKYQLIKIILML